MPKEKETDHTKKPTEKSKNKKVINKKYITLFAILVLLLGLLYFFRGLFLVALVNNKPITRLALVKQLEKESGKATLENLIVKELIMQEAKKKSVTVTEEDIQKEIDNITEIVEAQGTTLEVALSMQGQTMDDLRDNIKVQKTAEEILKDDINITDEDVLAYYEENKEFYEDREYVDLKEEIKEQLFQEKLQAKFSELLENLKSESNIRYLVNY